MPRDIQIWYAVMHDIYAPGHQETEEEGYKSLQCLHVCHNTVTTTLSTQCHLVLDPNSLCPHLFLKTSLLIGRSRTLDVSPSSSNVTHCHPCGSARKLRRWFEPLNVSLHNVSTLFMSRCLRRPKTFLDQKGWTHPSVIRWRTDNS